MRSDLLPFGKADTHKRARWLAPLSILLASLVTIVPVIATVPFLPPFGLLMLLGWRLHRADSLAVWAPAPLGLFDDMVSGQPVGSAMLFWTLCSIAIDVLDTRLVWRDFWQDWLIAAGAVGFCLIGTRLVATPLVAHVDTAVVLQILACAALFPLFFQLAARLDRDPER